MAIERSLPVFGWQDQHGHCEITFDNVRVPVGNLLGEEGGGFAIAQARLGPGRIHHCMRAIGVAERALALMVDRVQTRASRSASRWPSRAWCSSRLPSPATRSTRPGCCVTRRRGRSTSTATRARARQLVAKIKAVAPQMACNVIDRAIQVHGAAGISDDTPLARMYGWHRAMRLFDGPDEVHMRTIARAELGREKSAFAAAVTT